MNTKTHDKKKVCGHVVILGRPNVGKSTLLNQFIETHITATASKRQTTRNRIVGVRTMDNSQFVFVDTPGIHLQGKRLMNSKLNSAAIATIPEADVVLFLVEALKFTREDELVLDKLQSVTVPVILVINKVDLAKDKSELLPYIKMSSEKFPFTDIVPCSAKRRKTMPALLSTIESYLPEGEFEFNDDEITDRSMRFIGSELIREQLVRSLEQELPHAIAIEIETWEEDLRRINIGALIYVERKGQKKIVIGKGGSVLKRAGTQARKNISMLTGKTVHLQLWVKVKEGWQDSVNMLKQFGIEDN